MDKLGERAGAFRELWPFLALRYGLITLGVLVWLWETGLDARAAAGAALFSLALLLELPIDAVGHGRGRIAWAVAQFALGLAAFSATPGLAAGIVLAGIVCGFAARAPWPYVVACFGISTAAAAWLAEASVSGLVVLVGLYGLAIAVGRLFQWRWQEAERHRFAVEQLEQAQRRVADFAEQSRELAATRERQRLTEELHDTLGHALVGALLQVQVARKLMKTNPDAAHDRLNLVETSVRDTLDQVRRALRSGTQRGRLPLHLSLESLVADFRAAGGPDVELSLKPDPESVSDVHPRIAQTLYRTTREALTNAVRHGRASCIAVHVEAVGPRLYLRIADDGVGAEQYSPGMGLSGMIRRVQEAGGTLRFQTAPGQGFQVEVGVTRR